MTMPMGARRPKQSKILSKKIVPKRTMLWRSSSPKRHPPGFIEPCLPTLAPAVPSGPQWAYEIKHDGFRFICRREGDRVRVPKRHPALAHKHPGPRLIGVAWCLGIIAWNLLILAPHLAGNRAVL